MTPTQQKAMEMALEALMHVDDCTFVNDAGSFDLLNLYEDKHVCEAIKALRAALAEQADDKVDAERYRWLVSVCESDGFGYWLPEICLKEGNVPPSKSEADAAIDAARSKP